MSANLELHCGAPKKAIHILSNLSSFEIRGEFLFNQRTASRPREIQFEPQFCDRHVTSVLRRPNESRYHFNGFGVLIDDSFGSV